MKLIFMYGPPAVGKYTVGAALAEQTGYKLFHNHVTVDVARVLFDIVDHDTFDHERAAVLKDALRLDVIRVAAEDNINVIFTLAYTAGVCDEFVNNVVKIVTDQRGSVCFVQLHAPREELYARIGNESRARLGKPTSSAHLQAKFARGGLDKPVLFTNNMVLDTSRLTPEQSAQRIIARFHL